MIRAALVSQRRICGRQEECPSPFSEGLDTLSLDPLVGVFWPVYFFSGV